MIDKNKTTESLISKENILLEASDTIYNYCKLE